MSIYTKEYESLDPDFRAWYDASPAALGLNGIPGAMERLNAAALEYKAAPDWLRLSPGETLEADLDDVAERIYMEAAVDNMTALEYAGLKAMYNNGWDTAHITYNNLYDWRVGELLELYRKRHPDAPAAPAELTVKQIRAASGLSQQAFAARFGIPRRTLENWEGGIRKPPQYVVTMLAQLNNLL